MGEPLWRSEPNIRRIDLPKRLRITDHLGERPCGSMLLIRPGGRVFRRCLSCGKLVQVHPEGSQQPPVSPSP